MTYKITPIKPFYNKHLIQLLHINNSTLLENKSNSNVLHH